MTKTRNPKSADPRLERLLGGPALAALRLKMRRHFERQDSNSKIGTLQLTKLMPTEHEALALLTGRPTRSTQSVKIDIDQLDATLRNAGIAGSLREALELLDGPIVNRTMVKNDLLVRWSSVVNAEHLHPALSIWLQTTPATSLLKRLARQNPDTANRLLERASTVLRRLPVKGLTRAQLAADLFGNAHALDNGQPAATLVLAALQHGETDIAPIQDAPEDTVERTSDARRPAERARDIWARAGILVNELARPALFLNLPVRPESTFLGSRGEPGYLSLRQLLRTSIDWSVENQAVYVCENPNIVSIAADRLGSACAPLVCTDGMPAAAQRILLTQLARAGARLLYHGDFDWAGLHIANYVMRLCGAHPWRFAHDDYMQAIEQAPHSERDLGDSCVQATWDPALTALMQLQGLAIAEEAVASPLLDDLAAGQAPPVLRD